LLTTVQADMTTSAEMLNTIESVRSQLESLMARVASNSTLADVRARGDSLERKFATTEGSLIDLRMTGRGQDQVRYPARIGAQLDYLAGGIASSDFTPSTQQRRVSQVLAKQVQDTRAALRALINSDLAKYNALLRSKGLKTIDVPSGGVVF